MKIWRVGSFSMGAALIFLGVFLLVTQVFHWNAAAALAAWWPLILLILGIEVLLSLYFSKQEKPVVKYDILSIFIIGIIGMCGIALTIASTTGVLNKFTEVVAARTKTLDLPTYNKSFDNHIRRVVLDAQSQEVHIETTNEKALSVFGTYEGDVVKNQPMINSVDDYLMAEEKGDTLYLILKNPPRSHDAFLRELTLSETILIPENVRLELKSNDFNPIYVKLRSLSNNWIINGAAAVNIELPEDLNLLLQVDHAEELIGDGWLENKEHGDNNGETVKSGMMKFGNGGHHFVISNTSSVAVTHLP